METPKRQNAKTSKHRNAETSKRRSAKTPKRRNVKTSKRRNVETPQRQSAEAPTRDSLGRESFLGPGPPEGLPVDPGRFWSAEVNPDDLETVVEVDSTPALKRAGPLPFVGGRFPVMGFLATVYEQIASHAKDASDGGTAGES